jgi:biopolymer transport protein TolR
MGAGVVKKSGGGGRRGRRRGSSAAMADINITPFVDVMLVLMIIFMVTAPMMVSGIPLDLPKADAAPMSEPSEPPLTVSIDADGKLAIMTSEVESADLINKLKAIAATRKSQKIFLRADGALPYTRVAEVMAALSTGGFSEIGLVTDASGAAAAAPGAGN